MTLERHVSSSAQAKAGVVPIRRPERQPKSRDRETPYTFACLPAGMPACFLAQFTTVPCDGRMEKAHLIREQKIRREVSRAKTVLWHPAVWRPACHRHHGMLDQSKTLTIPRSAIPCRDRARTRCFACERPLEQIPMRATRNTEQEPER